MSEIKADVTLDAKELACPLPIVQTRKQIETLMPGQVLEVLATDPGSGPDIKAWANSMNHQFLGTVESTDLYKHYIRKAPAANETEKVHEQILDNDELEKRMKENDNLLVIDVREEAEYRFGHIPNTINIPLGQLEDKVEQIKKDKAVYLICRSGSRSDLAAKQLTKLGFKEVYNIVPGMSGWTGETKGL